MGRRPGDADADGRAGYHREEARASAAEPARRPSLAPRREGASIPRVPTPTPLAGTEAASRSMLSRFRSFAKTPFATGIFVLAMLGFLFVGGRSVFSGAGAAPNAVITAGGRTVSADDFHQIFQRALEQLSQRNGGQPVTPQDAVAHDVDHRLLDEMSQEEALSAWIARSGVRPSDALVAAELRRQPQFFNPVSGAFDKAAYAQLLAQNGLTPKKFEADLRDQIAQTQVLAGLGRRPAGPRRLRRPADRVQQGDAPVQLVCPAGHRPAAAAQADRRRADRLPQNASRVAQAAAAAGVAGAFQRHPAGADGDRVGR